MTFLKQLKKKSICPVAETVKHTSFFSGWFIHSSTSTSSDGRIQINKNMSVFEKEGTLTHEMGHARCHNRHCKCYKKYDDVLQEVHAELYTLHLLLRNHRKNGIKARFKRLQNDWNYEPHSEAREIIENRRIYKRCQEFVKSG